MLVSLSIEESSRDIPTKHVSTNTARCIFGYWLDSVCKQIVWEMHTGLFQIFSALWLAVNSASIRHCLENYILKTLRWMFNLQTLENWFRKSQGFVGELSKITPHGTVEYLI